MLLKIWLKCLTPISRVGIILSFFKIFNLNYQFLGVFLVISACPGRILIQPSCPSSPTQTLPLLGSDQQLVLNFHADLQDLYAAIVQQSNAQRRKRKLSEEERPAAEDGAVSPQGLFGFGVWKTSCGVSQLHNTTRFFVNAFCM